MPIAAPSRIFDFHQTRFSAARTMRCRTPGGRLSAQSRAHHPRVQLGAFAPRFEVAVSSAYRVRVRLRAASGQSGMMGNTQSSLERQSESSQSVSPSKSLSAPSEQSSAGGMIAIRQAEV